MECKEGRLDKECKPCLNETALIPVNYPFRRQTMPGNPRDEFRRHRLANTDSIGFRSIQPVKLFIHVWINGRDRGNKLQE